MPLKQDGSSNGCTALNCRHLNLSGQSQCLRMMSGRGNDNTFKVIFDPHILWNGLILVKQNMSGSAHIPQINVAISEIDLYSSQFVYVGINTIPPLLNNYYPNGWCKSYNYRDLVFNDHQES